MPGLDVETVRPDFPSFSEGLSLRPSQKVLPGPGLDFPSFSEGLSLRLDRAHAQGYEVTNFPSFSEGLSLRPENPETNQAP